MSDNTVISIALSLVATLFGLLTLIVGWLGNKIFNKLDEVSKGITTVSAELHTRINGLDTRLTHVEAVESLCQLKPSRRAADKNTQEE